MVYRYPRPVFYVFVVEFVAFILMMLVTFSIPITSTLYFLYSSEATGVRFGLWGWCLDEDGTCSAPLQLGYTWEPQIPNPITNAFVFYPLTVVSIILTMISLIPIAYARNARADRIFVIFAWISFTLSAISFLFMICIWSVAKSRFEKRGFTASYGPLPWLSLTSTLLLLSVAFSPLVLGPPPKVVPVAQKTRRLRRVTNQITDLESSVPRRKHRKHRQQSRHIQARQ